MWQGFSKQQQQLSLGNAVIFLKGNSHKTAYMVKDMYICYTWNPELLQLPACETRTS